MLKLNNTKINCVFCGKELDLSREPHCFDCLDKIIS